jgi:hypothetical protein
VETAGKQCFFNQKCLGGELVLQTIGDSPLAKQLPAKNERIYFARYLNKK